VQILLAQVHGTFGMKFDMNRVAKLAKYIHNHSGWNR